ncbi:hypothetical protein HOR75_gp66 [Shewanella phage SppYZU05]|uniref:Uncharacterized protein n=1 Tax=Shewanella phage SppYZU05 TaxID=1970795 RepID=A0A1W6JTJ4_9CAUD|nr:hypothetical protein HOR75_gp66 [Shewanella phage SppYZU05]ARM70592.1 hypothetical protein SppYZU05_66 [Shewanella phage SppYZU05]
MSAVVAGLLSAAKSVAIRILVATFSEKMLMKTALMVGEAIVEKTPTEKDNIWFAELKKSLAEKS